MDYKGINDNELLYLISDNNDDYKNVVFEKYKPIVLAKAKNYYKINKDSLLDFNDLVQIGYIGLNNAIRFYKEECGLFYTYACYCIEKAMSKEVYAKLYKKGKGKCTFVSYEDSVFGDDEVYKNQYYDDYAAFTRIKNFLDFFDAQVFELRLNGFKYQEIATLLNVTVTKIDYSIQKMRRKLKKCL